MEAKTRSHDYCTHYMIINPNEASFFDIAKLLFSGDLSKRKFIESSFSRQDSFFYRLLVVISTLLQKFLLMIFTPMRMMGITIETLLNFFRLNGGFRGLLRNVMRAKVVIPDRKAATYLSFVGFTDTRKELDSDIKHGDPMYYPALSIMACKAVYNNAAYNQALIEDQWEMELLGFKNYWNDFLQSAETQVVMFRDNGVDHDTIVVCFRGTQPFNTEDWCSDVDLSWFEFPHIGKIHSGFSKALGMQISAGWAKEVVPDPNHGPRGAPLAYYDIRDTLKDLLKKNPGAKFIVTGHSLGGALAALFPAILFYHDEQTLIERIDARQNSDYPVG